MNFNTKILLKTFISVLVIYLISIPFIYMFNLVHTMNGSVWIYLITHFCKYVAVIFLGFVYRKKYRNKVTENSNTIVNNFILTSFVLCVLLSVLGVSQKIFYTFTASFQVYDFLNNNLFLSIIWEQLFNNYLFTSFFVCAAIIFLNPIRRNIMEP